MNDIELLTQIPLIPHLTEKQLEKIKKRIGDYKRAKSMFGHSTSQTSYTLQTLNMISDSPFSRLKQCMAQIERRYEAVQEAYFKMEKKKLEAKKLLGKNDERSRLKLNEIQSIISMTEQNMGNSLRRLGMWQDMYDTIRISNHIPKDWNESDYEKSEYENLIRKAFRLGIQDITAHTLLSKASVEFFEQLGIHPQTAEHYTRLYLSDVKKEIEENHKEVTVMVMYNFLDNMAIKFEDCFKHVLKRIGLNEIGSSEFRA